VLVTGTEGRHQFVPPDIKSKAEEQAKVHMHCIEFAYQVQMSFVNSLWCARFKNIHIYCCILLYGPAPGRPYRV